MDFFWRVNLAHENNKRRSFIRENTFQWCYPNSNSELRYRKEALDLAKEYEEVTKRNQSESTRLVSIESSF